MKAPPPASQTRRQPRKKNTPCISDLAGVKFLLKKERVFFFRGSALQVFGQCGVTKCGRGKEKLFLREEKDLLCLGSFSKWQGLCIRRAGGCGRNARRIYFLFLNGGLQRKICLNQNCYYATIQNSEKMIRC